MAVIKAPLDQHIPLHIQYGLADCCLCGREKQIDKLNQYIADLERRLVIAETDKYHALNAQRP